MKKMKNRTWLFAVMFVMAALIFMPAVKAEAGESTSGAEKSKDGLWMYVKKYDYGEEIQITKYLGTDTEVKIPSVIDDLYVTGVREIDPKKNEKITSISLPSTINYLGSEAFTCLKALETVTVYEAEPVPEDKNISAQAELIPEVKDSFHNCDSLRSVELPDQIKKIGADAFESCPCLESVKFPINLKTLGSSVFSRCASLKK